MFIELAEVLDCPVCSDGYGLVAFVSRADRRRVLDGRLGCPICEVEFPIETGAVRLAEEATPEVQWDDPAGMALRLAALLGVSERDGSVVLLGPGVGGLAPRVAALAEKIEVLAVVDGSVMFDLGELESGVNPLVGLTSPWPVRPGSLHGVAYRGLPPLEETRRCLRAEGRLVVVDAAERDRSALEAAGFSTLATDETTWVGSSA